MAARARTSTPTATTAMAESSNTQSGRLRWSPTKGRRATRISAGIRSIALSMLTVASDRLTGIPFVRRSSRLLASSPPRIGRSQLRKVATW